MKIGRNELCICGSGKKYKKCCIDKNVESIHAPTHYSTAHDLYKHTKKPIKTSTGEEVMLVRLEYKIHNIENFRKNLELISCVSWESDNRFHLSYHEELEKVNLRGAYKNSKHSESKVLALCLIKVNILHVELLSVPRATDIAEFINKIIPSKIIKLENIWIVNKLFSSPNEVVKYIQADTLDYDNIFTEKKAQVISYKNMDELLSQKFPEVEKICITDKHLISVFAEHLLLRYGSAAVNFYYDEPRTAGEAFYMMNQNVKEEEVNNFFEKKMARTNFH